MVFGPAGSGLNSKCCVCKNKDFYTAAILAQGAPRSVAVMQAFLVPAQFQLAMLFRPPLFFPAMSKRLRCKINMEDYVQRNLALLFVLTSLQRLWEA